MIDLSELYNPKSFLIFVAFFLLIVLNSIFTYGLNYFYLGIILLAAIGSYLVLPFIIKIFSKFVDKKYWLVSFIAFYFVLNSHYILTAVSAFGA